MAPYWRLRDCLYHGAVFGQRQWWALDGGSVTSFSVFCRPALTSRAICACLLSISVCSMGVVLGGVSGSIHKGWSCLRRARRTGISRPPPPGQVIHPSIRLEAIVDLVPKLVPRVRGGIGREDYWGSAVAACVVVGCGLPPPCESGVFFLRTVGLACVTRAAARTVRNNGAGKERNQRQALIPPPSWSGFPCTSSRHV